MEVPLSNCPVLIASRLVRSGEDRAFRAPTRIACLDGRYEGFLRYDGCIVNACETRNRLTCYKWPLEQEECRGNYDLRRISLSFLRRIRLWTTPCLIGLW